MGIPLVCLYRVHMTATYDIIVIGIGPTRLSAACRLAKSYAAVAVIENAALLRLQLSSEHVVVVDGMMVADVAQFNVVGAEKLENDPIGTIDAEALDFVVLGAKIFAMRDG